MQGVTDAYSLKDRRKRDSRRRRGGAEEKRKDKTVLKDMSELLLERRDGGAPCTSKLWQESSSKAGVAESEKARMDEDGQAGDE